MSNFSNAQEVRKKINDMADLLGAVVVVDEVVINCDTGHLALKTITSTLAFIHLYINNALS